MRAGVAFAGGGSGSEQRLRLERRLREGDPRRPSSGTLLDGLPSREVANHLAQAQAQAGQVFQQYIPAPAPAPVRAAYSGGGSSSSGNLASRGASRGREESPSPSYDTHSRPAGSTSRMSRSPNSSRSMPDLGVSPERMRSSRDASDRVAPSSAGSQSRKRNLPAHVVREGEEPQTPDDERLQLARPVSNGSTASCNDVLAGALSCLLSPLPRRAPALLPPSPSRLPLRPPLASRYIACTSLTSSSRVSSPRSAVLASWMLLAWCVRAAATCCGLWLLVAVVRGAQARHARHIQQGRSRMAVRPATATATACGGVRLAPAARCCLLCCLLSLCHLSPIWFDVSPLPCADGSVEVVPCNRSGVGWGGVGGVGDE